MRHDTKCPKSGKWYLARECREFSTDGTAMGADIAHLYGTTNEAEINRLQFEDHQRAVSRFLTGMNDEQAEWEGIHDPDEDEDPTYDYCEICKMSGCGVEHFYKD